MNGVQTLTNLLTGNTFFKIPIYQRGYSWKLEHINAMLVDLENLIASDDEEYYTGVIVLQKTKQRWNELQQFNPTQFFIVDGQQRLTTLYIYLSLLMNHPKHENLLFDGNKNLKEILSNFIYSLDRKNYKLSYLQDSEDFDILKEIVNDYENRGIDQRIKNIYTSNILNAKKFMNAWLETKMDEEKDNYENYLKKVITAIVEYLKFDVKEFVETDDDSRMYVVFETINKRGKPLSDLESLKNRLIYLSSLQKRIEDNDRSISLKIQNLIKNTWRDIYSFLGKPIDDPLSDDDFLRDHWIMYSRFDKKGEKPYARDIFDLYFTSMNFLNSKPLPDFSNKHINIFEIEAYVKNLEKSIPIWFQIKKPDHEENILNFGLKKNSINNYLIKIKQLKYDFFTPLILAALYHHKNTPQEENIIELLKQIERYVFTLFYISERRSDLGSYTFQRLANDLFNNQNILQSSIINQISGMINGSKDYSRNFGTEKFIIQIKDLFAIQDAIGFGSWRGIKYFLKEYDVFDNSQDNIFELSEYELAPIFKFDKNSSDYLIKKSISHLNSEYQNLKIKQLLSCYYNLGNYVLLPKEYKNKIDDDNRFLSILNYLPKDSASYHYLKRVNEWTPKEIKRRGIDLLKFMEKRWEIEINNIDNLLFPDESYRF